MHHIEPIHRHKAHIPTIAKWHWDEWGHADPEGSLAAWTTALATRANVDSIPTGFVALNGTDEPIGSVYLVHADMSTRPELGPWIAGLYVIPGCRGRGLGSALMEHGTEACVQLGYKDLYLHTSTAATLYSRLGWRKLFRAHYERELVDVMHYAV
ncbi:MAG: GNAT family N-acetyltransferase [Pseudomonadales bacterium]|nr:GNAT family N-acetyltransferase [Pseudomonadales bacterium]